MSSVYSECPRSPLLAEALGFLVFGVSATTFPIISFGSSVNKGPFSRLLLPLCESYLHEVWWERFQREEKRHRSWRLRRLLIIALLHTELPRRRHAGSSVSEGRLLRLAALSGVTTPIALARYPVAPGQK
jgi:hypothetical protein